MSSYFLYLACKYREEQYDISLIWRKKQLYVYYLKYLKFEYGTRQQKPIEKILECTALCGLLKYLPDINFQGMVDMAYIWLFSYVCNLSYYADINSNSAL